MTLKSGMLALWDIELGDEIEAWCLNDYLDNREQDRAAEFQNAVLSSRYRVAHAALRLILSTYLKTSPRKIEFEKSLNGKPYLARHQNTLGLEFNLSHSHQRALVGVSLIHPVGIDIEHLRPVAHLQSIVKRYFHRGEITVPIEEKQFFSLWTRKEAQIKARGASLFENLNEVPDHATHIKVGNDYVAAYAIMGPKPSQVIRGHVSVVQKQLVLVPNSNRQ